MTSAQVCGTQNISQFNAMLYRPLYWYGNDYKPTIDYDYSIGEQPTFSDNNQTVTIKLNPWKWSNGESVTSRDAMFWINLYKADPSQELLRLRAWLLPGQRDQHAGAEPADVGPASQQGLQPGVVHLQRAVADLSAPAGVGPDARCRSRRPSRTTATCPIPPRPARSPSTSSSTRSQRSSARGRPLRCGASSTGRSGFRASPPTARSRWFRTRTTRARPKPTISKLVELPFTSDAAIFNEIRSGGPVRDHDRRTCPPQYAPQSSTVEGEGYELQPGRELLGQLLPVQPEQPEGRADLQPAVLPPGVPAPDRSAGLDQRLPARHRDPHLRTGPRVPGEPAGQRQRVDEPVRVLDASRGARSFRATAGRSCPNGTTTCEHPGTAANECGAGITAGEGISFNIDYQSGVAAIESEMNDLEAQAKRVGININLTTHPFDDRDRYRDRVPAEPARLRVAGRRTGAPAGSTARTSCPTGESAVRRRARSPTTAATATRRRPS